MNWVERLRLRAEEGAPVRVGIVGAGQMGAGLISQMEQMAGMRAVAVADLSAERAAKGYAIAGIPGEQVAPAGEAARARELLEQGRRVATGDPRLIYSLPEVEVVVEATGIPEVGAQVAYGAILAGKHIVNMNVETDATVGYILQRLAKAARVVYTLTAGDEPGAIKELYDFAVGLGFTVTAIGKGKNNPLNRAANPDSCRERAARQEMSSKMLASFEDGTKTMVEMTAVGNATGFRPEVRGARGLEATPATLAQVFVPRAAGGQLDDHAAVEYAVGSVAPGVFVIITTNHPKIAKDLRYLRVSGHGSYWSLYRPYHLANLETPLSIARAVLYGDTTLATERPPVCETVAAAKRDLRAGEQIDGLGGFTVYGLIERAEIARREKLVPLGLLAGARLRRDLPAGRVLTYEDVELDERQLIVQLRRLQDLETERK
ncbi:MAG: SAF domain-containing protein [Ardenticatenaceae bacterium]|nr:SAF domain-containing protein [Ardenticatenaceae bacterium]